MCESAFGGPQGYGMWTDRSHLKISNDPTWNGTQDLLSCGAVHQPIVPFLTPSCVGCADCNFDLCVCTHTHTYLPVTAYILTQLYMYVIDGGMVVILFFECPAP
jgi:hypothetical protein